MTKRKILLIRSVGRQRMHSVVWFSGGKKDKGRINVGVKWAEMTSDRRNIPFTGKRITFLTENVLREGDKKVLQVS